MFSATDFVYAFMDEECMRIRRYTYRTVRGPTITESETAVNALAVPKQDQGRCELEDVLITVVCTRKTVEGRYMIEHEYRMRDERGCASGRAES